jgi:hypothetical protein
MKPTLLALATGIALTFTQTAQARYGSFSTFSAEEKRIHFERLPHIIRTATECLQSALNHHNTFFRQWGVSPFYGDQSAFAKASPQGRRTYLQSYNRFSPQQIDFLLSILQPTSCIGLTLQCLEKGFLAARQDEIWQKLRGFTASHNMTGGALLHGLQELGWKLVYWNPDVSQNEAWDEHEKRTQPGNPKKIWGFHAYHWREVNRSRKYLYNRVDDLSTLVNFGRQTPEIMRRVPFFVGIAHAGYHVFPGSHGQIIEGHSTRRLHDPQTVESSPFNPLVNGGGPRGLYRSGLIAIPPGYVR